VNPVLHLDELVWGENGRAELGEKLVYPQVERLLLDPLLLVVVNHDLGDGNTGLLALDGLLICIAIGEAIGIVTEHIVGSIGSASNCNQVIRNFLVKTGPFKVCLLDDTIDLGHRKSIFFAQSFGLNFAHLSKELFGATQVSRLFPGLGSPENEIRNIVSHGEKLFEEFVVGFCQKRSKVSLGRKLKL